MNRGLSPFQDPKITDGRRPADAGRLEAVDPAAAFAPGQWGMANRLAQPGRELRRH